MKPIDKNTTNAANDNGASAVQPQETGSLSQDVKSLLGIDALDSTAPAAANAPPSNQPKPSSMPQAPAPSNAIDDEIADSAVLDEFAQWEDQVNEQVEKRYRRSSDKYQGVERRKANRNVEGETQVFPEFPELSVVVYEPVAIVRGTVVELFDNFNIPVTEATDFDEFKIALEQRSLKDTFTVAILGDEDDVELNAARVQELRGEHPDKPLVFLSQMDLSQLRRRILHAGASYFIQKPSMDTPNLGSLQVIKKRFLDDLLLFVSECHARYIAVYNALTELDA